MAPAGEVVIRPLTAARWADAEKLFGPRGACAGCWCMWARLPRAEYVRGVGERNKRRFRALVKSGARPGLIAYVNREPAGWCAVAPRVQYRRLEASKVLAPVDERPVWSVPCFFVARDYRRRGLSVRLLREAAAFAARRGARLLEGYPVDARGRKSPDAFVWTGLESAFRAAGFREALRRSRSRPIMRKALRRPAALSRG